MIVPAEDIEAILAGELDDAILPEPLSVGAVHAIQTRAGEQARCHVEILERWRHAEGGWVHRFMRVPRPHIPHLLHKNPGAGRSDYTTRPGNAMREEGEAPSREDMILFRQIAKVQALRDREERRKVQEQLSLEKRVVAYQHEAKRRRIDIRNEMRLVHRLKSRGKSLDNAMQGIRRKLDSDLDQAA